MRGSASLLSALPKTRPATLHRALGEWYARSRRDLPWRRTRDPFRIWVSEVMLQQTTVRAATPYYEAFVNRFPTLAQLAASTDEDVLAAWSGLGYYHRARNLHRGARHVVERHGGSFPRTIEKALAVPGVGLYTASAVLSIAYGLPFPVVDGNVRRVLARLFALRGPEWRRDGAFYNLAEELLQREAPGEWNQALMELGASPLRTHCRAKALSLVEELPEGKARRPSVDVTVAAALITKGDRLLLVRREAGRLMGRMWEVPQTSLESRGLPDLAREIEERHGLRVVAGPLAVSTRHAITFRRIRLEGYRTSLRQPPPADPERYRWVSAAEAAELPTSSMTKKLLHGLRDAQLPLELK